MMLANAYLLTELAGFRLALKVDKKRDYRTL